MNKIHNWGAMVQFQLMVSWKTYANNTYGEDSQVPPGHDGNWSEYETVITDALQDILSLEHASTGNVIAEVWNEPNGKIFWPYTGQYSYQKHFIDTWYHAYNAIKSIDLNLRVVGPTFSGFWWKGTPDNDIYNKTMVLKVS